MRAIGADQFDSMVRVLALAATILSAACHAPQTEPIVLGAIYAQPDPIAEYLLSARWRCEGDHCADSQDIDRIADAIERHSARLDLPAHLMVGVLMVEDPWLDTLVASAAGARGLYQVMPMHADAWPECTTPLTTIDGSVCRGAEVLADFRRGRSLTQSLLRYNGCNRPGPCRSYPDKVLREASLVD